MTERSIFLEALDKEDPAQRSTFLDTACAGDDELRQRVEALLKSHAEAGNFLGKLAPQLLAEELPLPQTAEMQDETRANGQMDMDLGFLTPTDKTDALGRLGHYDILDIIGRGGMGIVLRAFDEKLHRVVAIKVMAAQLATNAAARKRFSREAQAQAALSHDHVVTIHAVEEANGLPYLVMQYVSGMSLQERLDKSGPLQLADIVRIGMQTAAGLAAAHAQGLIHRDIKPANILLENGVERVKITDFGLARAAADASLTQSGVLAGTPQYMSPEQAEGKPVDRRSDQFSLGSVLYAMCTGRAPFRAVGSMAILKRVCEETPTPIREINPEIPDWLAAIIDKLHAKDPAERYQSATEVAEILGQHLAHLQHPSVVPLPANMQIEDRRSRIEDRRSILNPRSSILKRRWAIAAVVLVCLFGGLSLTEAIGITRLRATVIRIFTPDGTLIVETDDPAVKVTVEGDGDLVITGAGAQEVRLRPGSYKVQATKDGKSLKLDRDLVTIERGGKQVVRVRLEGEAPSPIPSVTITDTVLIGSFTVSLKLPGAKDPIVRKYTINERLASKADDLGKGKTIRAYPWGWLSVQAKPGPGNKLVLKRLKVNVSENWGDIRGESLGFSTVKTDYIDPRQLDGMKLTTARGEIPLFFDESAGLDVAEITVTGALKMESTKGMKDEPTAAIITNTALIGSFTVSVKLPGAKDPIVRKYTIDERVASKAGDLGKGLTRKGYPWGWLQVEASPGPGNELILKRLWVHVAENWGHIRGESLGFTTGKTDFPENRLLSGMRLTTAGGEIPLYFDESRGLDRAEITVTGALKIESRGGTKK